MSELVNPPGPPPPPPTAGSTRTPRRPKAQATRRRILDAARGLFVERGERPWVDEIRHDPDPESQLRRWVREGRHIAARVAALWEVARNAAPADPDIAAQVHRYKTLTLQGHRYFVAVLAANGGLRDGLDPQRATDIVFGLLSHELYRLLVIEQGWAPEDWERWAADTLAAQLLPAH